eukprot:s58_g42.t2
MVRSGYFYQGFLGNNSGRNRQSDGRQELQDKLAVAVILDLQLCHFASMRKGTGIPLPTTINAWGSQGQDIGGLSAKPWRHCGGATTVTRT